MEESAAADLAGLNDASRLDQPLGGQLVRVGAGKAGVALRASGWEPNPNGKALLAMRQQILDPLLGECWLSGLLPACFSS